MGRRVRLCREVSIALLSESSIDASTTRATHLRRVHEARRPGADDRIPEGARPLVKFTALGKGLGDPIGCDAHVAAIECVYLHRAELPRLRARSPDLPPVLLVLALGVVKDEVGAFGLGAIGFEESRPPIVPARPGGASKGRSMRACPTVRRARGAEGEVSGLKDRWHAWCGGETHVMRMSVAPLSASLIQCNPSV